MSVIAFNACSTLTILCFSSASSPADVDRDPLFETSEPTDELADSDDCVRETAGDTWDTLDAVRRNERGDWSAPVLPREADLEAECLLVDLKTDGILLKVTIINGSILPMDGCGLLSNQPKFF
eukprot:CAMPEP_0181325074 /NCGR_PEP_ID=MMETSP1101-20121128/20717_1 /TAXON_ID=46948 /ORGANISM="Rhodomonas abbreviata, Strain Caron Lab Isolate" /LENGTH=122 /DNA_ID=CAMNT_0023433329 /DNA_START=297 /DNA_END=662 /DNA_ORIENTATION=+